MRDRRLEAEDGDEIVDTTSSEARHARAGLGAGDDTFTGGPGADFVWASDPWVSPS